jgi:(p)ppGpp synthase/HD superfamily hydrolase
MNDSTESQASDDKTPTLYSPLVEQAFRVAATAHRNQKRKGSDLPYFQHPASVALILARCRFDDDHLLAAAVLHDTIEDTDCTLESLTADFPEAVVKIVEECSESKTDAAGAKLPWRVRKESHIAVVREASRSARAIVLADKLHNLGSMVFDLERGEELWSRFNAAPDDLIWYHREIVAAACGNASENATQLDQLAADCQRLIDQLAALIPK